MEQKFMAARCSGKTESTINNWFEESSPTPIEKLKENIKLHSFAFYDEFAEHDRMCYQIIYKNGRKESISADLYDLLKEVLS